MVDSESFCSERARSREEKIFGTAPRVNTWLLIEHPAAWSAKALPDENLEPALRASLARAASAIPHSRRLMIRCGGRREAERENFVVHSRERDSFAARLPLKEGGFDAADIARPAAELRLEEPLFLVCTHGTHDKCCSKFGHATFRAILDLPTTAAWECSHVGGDRFAGNLLCFPDGLYYGNVTTTNALDIVAAYRRREIYLDNYRGRSCYGRSAQVGDYFVRRESGLLGLDDLTHTVSTQTSADHWKVQFESAAYVHEVEFRAEPTVQVEGLTCNAPDARGVTQYEMVSYRVTGRSERPPHLYSSSPETDPPAAAKQSR